MEPMRQQKTGTRARTHGAVAAALLVRFAAVRDAKRRGSAQLGVLRQVVVTVPAAFGGVAALARAYSKKNKLCFGFGFLGTKCVGEAPTLAAIELRRERCCWANSE